MKFTMKANRPTGKYKSFDETNYDIKLNKKVVGTIFKKYTMGQRYSEQYTINLMVMKNGTTVTDDNKNCEWKNIYLKQKFDSPQEALKYMNDNAIRLQNQFELYQCD